MKAIMLAIALSTCPVPRVVNKTKFPINDRDREIIKTCQERCVKHFPDAPCLKYFEKWGEHDYNCLCGK